MDLYALTAALVALLGYGAFCFWAGRATIDDALAGERGRADRAEALAEARRLALVDAAARALRAREQGQAAADLGARLDVALAGGAAGGGDLGSQLDELLHAAGRGGGPAPGASPPGAGQAQGHAGRDPGVGSDVVARGPGSDVAPRG